MQGVARRAPPAHTTSFVYFAGFYVMTSCDLLVLVLFYCLFLVLLFVFRHIADFIFFLFWFVLVFSAFDPE